MTVGFYIFIGVIISLFVTGTWLFIRDLNKHTKQIENNLQMIRDKGTMTDDEFINNVIRIYLGEDFLYNINNLPRAEYLCQAYYKLYIIATRI